MNNCEIWRYILTISMEQKIEMPKSAKIMHVQSKQNAISLWAEVDYSLPKVIRTFHVYATGERFDRNNKTYIGTVLTDNESYVWHIYEVH